VRECKHFFGGGVFFFCGIRPAIDAMCWDLVLPSNPNIVFIFWLVMIFLLLIFIYSGISLFLRAEILTLCASFWNVVVCRGTMRLNLDIGSSEIFFLRFRCRLIKGTGTFNFLYCFSTRDYSTRSLVIAVHGLEFSIIHLY